MRVALARCVGPNPPDLGDDWADPDAYARLGLTMTEEVLRGARAVIVSTHLGAATVRSVAPNTPVHVVPLPVPARRARRTEPSGTPLVVSLGWVDPIKRPLDVVEAFARATRNIPARLAFVGECAPFLADAIRDRAAQLGIADRVEVTGFVDDADEYEAWLRRATCLVQLRRRSQGESSGAVVDAIATGVPAITSVASASELPDGVVDVVEPDAPAEVVAAHLERLLGDETHRRAMAAAGADYARSWTARDAAGALLAVLEATAP
jgi:glycosyltransferase involved in cell wall biosynthesis